MSFLEFLGVIFTVLIVLIAIDWIKYDIKIKRIKNKPELYLAEITRLREKGTSLLSQLNELLDDIVEEYLDKRDNGEWYGNHI